jgi:hypothetical protein
MSANNVAFAASLDHVMAETHLVIDGSNIATEGRSEPSLAQLDDAVKAYLKDHSFDNVVVVVDATFPNRIDQSERAEYEEAVEAGEIITPPAGTVGRGDAFILMVAERSGATVMSNDSFQEFHPEHPWLFEEGRLVGGKPVPGVGWVFVGRTPVRGPRSRRATADAKRKAAAADGQTSSPGGRGAGRKKQSKKQSSAKESAKKAAKTPAKKSPAKKAPARKAPSRKETAKQDATSSSQGRSTDSKRSRRRRSKAVEPINEPQQFLDFIADHQPGASVDAEVVEFTSHGAYADCGGVRCYVPLKSMGDPPPRSPRELLELGEQRSFIVQEYDPPRRGIVLALSGDDQGDSRYRDAPTSTGDDVDKGTGTQQTMKPAEEASVAAKKKAPAKRKAPAKKKAPAKRKAPAKKKAPAKRR